MASNSRDIGAAALYCTASNFYRAVHAPGEAHTSEAAHLTVRSDGLFAAFTGTTFQSLAAAPHTRICVLDLRSGSMEVLKGASGSDRLPRWSPDATRLAFLSDRAEAGNFQLYLLEGDLSAEPQPVSPVEGVVEFLEWSPDSSRLLLGVAGFGADLSACEGGHTTITKAASGPQWRPTLDEGDAENLWRRLYVFEPRTRTLRQVCAPRVNCWEATWLGPERIAAVVSDSHREGSWYQSRAAVISLDSGTLTDLWRPQDQIGVPAGSPRGEALALIEAVCSDRQIVAGALVLLDATTGARHVVDTHAVDVTWVEWRDEYRLLYTGMRGLETVVGEVDRRTLNAKEQWRSLNRTLGGWYPAAAPIHDGGCVAVGEAYDIPPEIAVIRDGSYRVVRSLAPPSMRPAAVGSARVEPFEWTGRDGLELQGWLVLPPGRGPFPLVMEVHGGPIWCTRSRWQGHLRGTRILADRGVASFYPNPRGSSGRGLEFARLVQGDLGGEDTYDLLAAIDALTAQGIADPNRLGVTGVSYGGYMSAWIITQDARFAAAVPISPATDFYSLHRTTDLPEFYSRFLRGDPCAAGGAYHARSPVMFAARVRTPTLQMAGALDKSTPPGQALEFHRSLLEHRARSVLVTYPTGGHGVRGFPETIDVAARYVGWMLQHLKVPLDQVPVRPHKGRHSA